jgi:hypothetical protein
MVLADEWIHPSDLIAVGEKAAERASRTSDAVNVRQGGEAPDRPVLPAESRQVPRTTLPSYHPFRMKHGSAGAAPVERLGVFVPCG